MKTLILLIIYSSLWNFSFAQPIPADSMYLGQVPPGIIAKIFILPVNGTMRPVERITITSDGKEIYYCEINTYPANIQRIKCYKYEDNRWQGPFLVFEGYMCPALSADDNIMYMESNVNAFANSYYSIRTGSGWSVPAKCIYTGQQTHYFQGTNFNNLYLSATFPGINSKELAVLQFTASDTIIKNLGKPMNTGMDENDFFISGDESYIIHARSSSSAAGDLYISYKKTNGKWTNSKSLGPRVNVPGLSWEYGCYVTDDNKYLFFTSGGNTWSSYYVYWVRIDDLIDSLKYTNYTPYLNDQIPDQTDTAGRQYSYTFPDSTFIDDDGNNTLTYSASLSSGAPLPSWLHFDRVTRTFSSAGLQSGSISVKVSAVDTANASAYCTFTLNIVQQIGLNPVNEIVPEEYNLLQNYPNPFNPATNISFDIPKAAVTKLVIYNIQGREVGILVNEYLKPGSYKVDFFADYLSSGIYFYKIISGSYIQTKKMILLK